MTGRLHPVFNVTERWSTSCSWGIQLYLRHTHQHMNLFICEKRAKQIYCQCVCPPSSSIML
ncbi:MAG: hypothetical protein ACI90V_008305 [Bacillariaceae sp.]|jgi:hypothetical protein